MLQQLDELMPDTGGTAAEEPVPAWQVAVETLDIKDWRVDFRDDRPKAAPVNLALSGITLKGEGLTTEKGGEPGRVSGRLTFQESGQISLKGTLDPASRKGRLALGVKGINIREFQPYFTDYLNIDITGGRFGAKVDLQAAFPASGDPSLTLTGEGGVSDVSSKDKITGNVFFRAKSLFVSGLDVSLWPVGIRIKEVSLTDFYNRAILTESGQLNYRSILVSQDKTDVGKQAESVGSDSDRKEVIPPIEVKNITLQGGHINFTDLFTQPNYTANMTRIAGRISSLSSTAAEPADVTLKGVHGLYSPLDITGKIRPFGAQRMADMTLSFKNIELTQFNAYAEKYLGYEIETGKLVLNLAYQIRGNELESSNRLFFDQFNLGKRVESKDATSLPIDLAISLLKNSKDQIDLDIPVKGNLDDPEFSYGSVVAKAFKNLILSVVAAPFKLLGKVFGGWDSGELGFVAFEPGKDSLDDESRAKLDQLREILAQKETLKFMIEGKYDPVLDARALRKDRYNAMIVATAGKKSDEEAEAFLADPVKRLRYVERLYKRADFPKPRDEQGKEKKISPEEMETLLVTNISVSEQDLSALASRRSSHIVDYLASSEKIDPQRLFVQVPGPVDSEDKTSQAVKTVFKVE